MLHQPSRVFAFPFHILRLTKKNWKKKIADRMFAEEEVDKLFGIVQS